MRAFFFIVMCLLPLVSFVCASDDLREESALPFSRVRLEKGRDVLGQMMIKRCRLVSTPVSSEEEEALSTHLSHPDLTPERRHSLMRRPDDLCEVLKQFWGLFQYGSLLSARHETQILEAYASAPLRPWSSEDTASLLEFDTLQLLYDPPPDLRRLQGWLSTDMVEICPQTRNPLMCQLGLMGFMDALSRVPRYTIGVRVDLCTALQELDPKNPDRVTLYNGYWG